MYIVAAQGVKYTNIAKWRHIKLRARRVRKVSVRWVV